MTPPLSGRLVAALPLCLASASPRRKALLEVYGLDFTVCPADVDETAAENEEPEAYVRRLSAAKAAQVAERMPGHGIMAGDTTVVADGVLLGKPVSPENAAQMIRALSGRTHQVVTAYSLLDARDGTCRGRTVVTRVTFRKLPDAWIDWYASLDETVDKAGAYALQGIGGAMVHRIDGSYANVIGFPVETIVWDLMERGWVKLS